MTDDLVKRLREWAKFGYGNGPAKIMDEAADRIEQLEAELHSCFHRIEELQAALREIAAGYETEWSTSTMGNMFDVAQILSERISIARKALEGKDD